MAEDSRGWWGTVGDCGGRPCVVSDNRERRETVGDR